MNIYSYRLDHDLGLAPNPFGKYCTLTVCKPIIRKNKNLNLGDWIIGTGSKVLERATGRKLTKKLIFAMSVSEIINLTAYWNDTRFQYKKPIMNGSLVAMFGDNFYHKNEYGYWIQGDSSHSNIDGSLNIGHLKRDTKGCNAIISEFFYYFGDCTPLIPTELIDICKKNQGHKIIKGQLAVDFIQWLTSNFQRGIQGEPLNWNEYNQRTLFY